MKTPLKHELGEGPYLWRRVSAGGESLGTKQSVSTRHRLPVHHGEPRRLLRHRDLIRKRCLHHLAALLHLRAGCFILGRWCAGVAGRHFVGSVRRRLPDAAQRAVVCERKPRHHHHRDQEKAAGRWSTKGLHEIKLPRAENLPSGKQGKHPVWCFSGRTGRILRHLPVLALSPGVLVQGALPCVSCDSAEFVCRNPPQEKRNAATARLLTLSRILAPRLPPKPA